MKYFVVIIVAVLFTSCGAKVPFTETLRQDFDLESEAQLKQIQFYISQTIVLKRAKQISGSGTTENGALVSKSNKEENRIIIQAQTRGVLEKYNESGEMYIRFENGAGRYLTFKVNQPNNNNKYHLDAKWDASRGGELIYGNEKYIVDAGAGRAYLMVILKKLQNTKRKDRVAKGIRV
ncbi:MAG: hypothetical protein M9916_04695 [Crocinitomicaceae bacterium]|nr:hypothetical protein [Crocinitomicaceae bacterium]